MKIPVCEPLIAGRELEYVLDCMRSGWISSKGKYIGEFERRFSEYCRCSEGISTTNGTSALHLALASIGIKKGDEVIVPAFTMISTVLAIVYCGATPVLVDVEPDTGNMDPHLIEEMVGPKTRAIMPVHIYGHPCDMSPILSIARKYGLYVVEDAAEAHGAEYKGKRAGGIGDVGCFSFYGNKIITTGEGGMVVSNDEEVITNARLLKDLAFSSDNRYLHERQGFNYRMTNVQAAIGLGQLERIGQLVEIRRSNAIKYNGLLEGVEGITLPVEKPWAKNVYWMYSIRVEEDFGIDRDHLRIELDKKGIDTRSFFIPMHMQPAFLSTGLFKGEVYPISEGLSKRGLYLPSSPQLTDGQIRYICETIRHIKEGL
jgi:perosamine synthetase